MNKKKLKKKLLNLWKDIKKTCKKVYKDFWDHKKHSKKVDRIFSQINSLLVILIIGMILFGLLWFVGGFVKDKIEEFIEDRFILKLINVQGLVYENEPSQEGSRINPGSDVNLDLISSSFTDLFSGVGWINQDKTTFYHDKITTAFLFPPQFSWKKVNEGSIEEDSFVEIKEDGSDRRCFNSSCLAQKDLNLYFADESVDNLEQIDYRIDFPERVNTDNLVNVSIGSLDSKWLVGFVEKIGEEEYLGQVFYFDGESFESLSEEVLFDSEYKGKIGFGGSDSNFLVVYGGYRGQAYHIIPGEKQEDISRFFRIRLMNDGFQPYIIKGNQGNWYIYSLTEGNPRFIKLFQNGTDSIQGVVNLTEFINISRAENAYFYLSNDDSNTLFSKISNSNNEVEYWRFIDEGFDKSSSQTIFSSDINNNPSEVREAEFVQPELSDIGANISFYLSNNGRDWFEVDIGEKINFPDKSGRRLLWKGEFEPSGDSMTTPFFDLLRLKYKIHFP